MTSKMMFVVAPLMVKGKRVGVAVADNFVTSQPIRMPGSPSAFDSEETLIARSDGTSASSSNRSGSGWSPHRAASPAQRSRHSSGSSRGASRCVAASHVSAHALGTTR